MINDDFGPSRDSDSAPDAPETRRRRSAAKRQKRLGKAAFKAAAESLRLHLVNAQYRLQEADFNVVVMLAGADRAGCDQVVDRLQEWMDVRYLDTAFWGPPAPEERVRPTFWRYWRAMPRHGRSAIFVDAWVVRLAAALDRGEVPRADADALVAHYRALDRMLAANGTVLVKLWLHLEPRELGRRIDAARHDPELARYQEPGDRELADDYRKARRQVKRLLDETGTVVPWQRIDARHDRNRDVAVATAIRDAIEARLDKPRRPPPAPDTPESPPPDRLAQVDLGLSLPYKRYRRRLDELQLTLHRLTLDARRAGLGSVLVFEGWDAAGKGGVIRRLTQAISARDCKVHRIGAPSPEEQVHNYMWRFWQRLPADGAMGIFDRSWYGRVLVERVEGLASPADWGRAYDEINDFEAQLAGHGQPVLKFWLHIDPDEQLRRFMARRKTAYKKYKLTDEDFRNRDKWARYANAANEMFARTDTAAAPWHLVPANDKRWARVQVLETVCEALEAALARRRRDRG